MIRTGPQPAGTQRDQAVSAAMAVNEGPGSSRWPRIRQLCGHPPSAPNGTPHLIPISIAIA